jgi:hypothetical protein
VDDTAAYSASPFNELAGQHASTLYAAPRMHPEQYLQSYYPLAEALPYSPPTYSVSGRAASESSSQFSPVGHSITMTSQSAGALLEGYDE